MTFFTIVLSVSCLALVVLLSISVYFNIKHGILLLKLQDSIEESLDILDIKYKKISEILEIPIFFDSVEVRQVISELGNARDAILFIANDLTSIENEQQEESDDAS